MRKISIAVIACVGILISFVVADKYDNDRDSIFGAPPYGESEESVPKNVPLPWFVDWARPEGPAKVALQVGHWKNSEFPEELAKLRGNSGASGGGKMEWEVNLVIAEETAKLLRAKRIIVDILPATVPTSYWADVFLAIHADGSVDSGISGFKIASPWRDFTGSADELVNDLYDTYKATTNMDIDPNISRNMRGYYAFSWWKYEHAIHPMTTAAIIETGFLTNRGDRQIIVNDPQTSAAGIAEGIIKYLESEGLLEN